MGRISFSTIKNWNLFSSVIYRVQISSLRPFAKTREQTHFFGQHHVSSIMYHTPIKLVSLDLDGTTLNNDHKFSDRTVQILKRLSASGVIITLASGRSTLDISKHFDVLDLPQQIEPGVSYNGAFGFVREHHEGEKVGLRKIFERPVNSELADDLISFASELGHVLHYYNGEIGEVFAVPKNDEHRALLARYAALVSRDQILIDDYEIAKAKSLPAKVLILSNDADTVYKKGRERYSAEQLNIFIGSPHPYFVEFLNPAASKGAGLALVCEHLGIDVSQVVAFGDGDNDREMLQVAGLGVAMRNATPAAKQAANVVLEWSNDEDGVARQLEWMEAQGYFRSETANGDN